MSPESSAFSRLRARLGKLGREDLSMAVMGHGSEKLFGGLAGIAVILALSKGELAFYGAAFNVLLIASKISDFGLDTSLLRAFSKAHRAGDETMERALFRTAFVTKVGASLLTFGVGWLISPYLAAITDYTGLTPFLRLGFAGVLGKQLTGLFKAFFGGRLEFDRNALFVALGPAFWLLGLTVVWLWVGSLGPEACLLACVGGPLLACGIMTIWARRFFLERSGLGFAPLRAVVNFSRWIYLAEVIGLIRSKLGGFVLLAVISADASGAFDAADRVASLVTVFTAAMMTVLIPKASRLKDIGEMRDFLGKSRKALPYILLGVPASYLLSLLFAPLVEWVRPAYYQVPPLFGILLASMVLSIAAYPAFSLIYALHKPQVQTAIEVLILPITIGLFYVLVPEYGAFGAAWAMFVQRLVSAILYIGYAEWRLRPGATLD